MSAIKITADINGQAVDIKDCAWYFISPCGCTHGVMTTKDYENDGWITSPEAAHVSMTPNKAVREQDKALGETVELGLHSDCVTRLRAECTHTPQWGRQTIPSGMAWGRASGGRSAHIVDSETEGDDDYRRQWRDPKCGAKNDLFEIGAFALSEAPMCKKCISFAKDAAA
jgi:hypothetical protein